MLQKAPRIEGANNIGNVAEHTIAILYFMPEHYVLRAEEIACEKEMVRAKYMDALCSSAARGRWAGLE